MIFELLRTQRETIEELAEALEHLGQFLANRLNERCPKSVEAWIVSEMWSYRPADYPLLQLQCLDADGEALQNCRGSVRYALVNQQVIVGGRQQLGFRFTHRSIAKAFREYEALNEWRINADCNGAANIIRKVAMIFGFELKGISRGVLTAPVKTQIWG